jgi:hypothetical protein
VVETLSRMLDLKEENGVPNQTMDVTLLLLQLMWLKENFEYFVIEFFLFGIAGNKRKN